MTIETFALDDTSDDWLWDSESSIDYDHRNDWMRSYDEDTFHYCERGYYKDSDACAVFIEFNVIADLVVKGWEIPESIGDVYYVISEDGVVPQSIVDRFCVHTALPRRTFAALYEICLKIPRDLPEKERENMALTMATLEGVV